MLQTITWTDQCARLLDQTKLPAQTVYVDITDEKQMWDAIRRLVVRGAPAIGVAAAFGVYLGVRGADAARFRQRLDEVCDYLCTSRPTAVNLAWAAGRVRSLAIASLDAGGGIDAVKQAILDLCLEMIQEDNRVCRAIGEHGLSLLQSTLGAARSPLNILTHCNAGGLATVRYGTALAPIYVGAERGIRFHVWSDETRPLLQGSRITAFELRANGVPVTVICDSMAASVMSEGRIDAVIVGADRVAANGDVANKIGTHGVAIVARHFGIPFYVAAPASTVDLALARGALIPIEQRDPAEISRGLGRQTAPDDVEFHNPAFDVTPANLITAIITEHGIAQAPYEAPLRQAVAAARSSQEKAG
jgi:methylthioribose-1-phosphate isomerase